MAKHVGVKLPDDLLEVLKKGKTVGILATFSEKGLPHTTPIQCLYPKVRKYFNFYTQRSSRLSQHGLAEKSDDLFLR